MWTSMYGKRLLTAEIELIRRRIAANAKILDAGCERNYRLFRISGVVYAV
jgi:hypothetical protein